MSKKKAAHTREQVAKWHVVHQVSAPTETFCAWCRPGEPSPTGSHGICSGHAAELMRDLEATK